MSGVDKVFDKPISKQFEFDDSVASVFDDMLSRSVPYYSESMELTRRFVINALEDGSLVYDLGCSTASTLLEIERSIKDKSVRLVGIDNSAAMIEHASKKLRLFNSDIVVEYGDILEYDYESSKAMISNYTLQFIRPMMRDRLIQKIYSSLEDGGVFLFSEKVVSADAKLDKQLIDCYYDFKKTQGYSEYEIVQKREALENVLIPYTVDENIKMAKNSGFKSVDVIFKWANFATFIAIK